MPKYKTYILLSNGERINFILDAGQRKSCSLAVVEGQLIVRVPKFFQKDLVQNLIIQHLDWIHSALSKAEQKIYRLPKTYEEGEKFTLLGQQLCAEFVLSERYFKPYISEGRLKVSVCPTSDKAYKSAQINDFMLSLAGDEIRESMERMSKEMGLEPDKVTLKSMTSCWGRCSSERKISMNYKLIAYPKECIDYVCIHELSHLVYMNHSEDFWKLVAQYFPRYKQIRLIMKE